jgi:hypothetical protein
MQNLYHSNDLVATRQTDGSVFLIRPNTTPQEMMTLTNGEWLQMLTIETITNPNLAMMHDILNKQGTK